MAAVPAMDDDASNPGVAVVHGDDGGRCT